MPLSDFGQTTGFFVKLLKIFLAILSGEIGKKELVHNGFWDTLALLKRFFGAIRRNTTSKNLEYCWNF